MSATDPTNTQGGSQDVRHEPHTPPKGQSPGLDGQHGTPLPVTLPDVESGQSHKEDVTTGIVRTTIFTFRTSKWDITVETTPVDDADAARFRMRKDIYLFLDLLDQRLDMCHRVLQMVPNAISVMVSTKGGGSADRLERV